MTEDQGPNQAYGALDGYLLPVQLHEDGERPAGISFETAQKLLSLKAL